MNNLIANLQKPLRQTSLLVVLALGGILLFTPSLSAQTVTYSSEMNIPYGRSYRDENAPYNSSSRSNNGNRLIVNGRIVNGDGSTLVGGIGGDFFGGQSTGSGAGAIGNQLNVITMGNWNTVIIDSTQINTGNQTVNLDGANTSYDPPIADSRSNSIELNGEINLDD